MRIKAAVLHEKGAPFQMEYVDLADPKENEVLVKVAGTGICHTDEAVRGSDLVHKPAVLGHEGSGVIEKIGPGVEGFEVGDHVVITYATCGKCKYCLDNMPYVCDEYRPLNTGSWLRDGTSRITQDGKPLGIFFGQGSFATHCVVDKHNLVKVDKDVDIARLGPLGCGFMTGAGTIFGHLDVQPGTSIAIFGMGGVSFSALVAAKIRGCKTIIAVGGSPEKLALAKELGATHVINRKETEDVVGAIKAIVGRGVDYCFESSGAQAMITYALGSAGAMGHVALVGGSYTPIEFMPLSLLNNNVSITVVNEGAIDPKVFIPMMVNYIRDGRFPIEKLEQFYDFDDIEVALEDHRRGVAIKPVVRMPV